MTKKPDERDNRMPITRPRMIHGLLLICSMGILPCSALANEPIYTKTASLPPLRITYAELQSLLDKSAALLIASPPVEAASRMEETLSLSHGESQIEITGHQLPTSGAKLPEFVTELRYTGSWYPRNAAVSVITMSFSDLRRELTVQGTSPEQVEAVFAGLRNDLEGMSSLIGGGFTRLALGLAAFLVCMIVAWSVAFLWFDTRNSRLILPFLLSCFGIVLVLLLPFDSLLAGFSASELDASFIRRYAPEISLLGVLATLVGIPFSYVAPRWFAKHAKPDSPVSPQVDGSLVKPSRRKRGTS